MERPDDIWRMITQAAEMPGTTGAPKGAQLTHRSCVNNLMNMMFSAQAHGLATQRATGAAPPAAPIGGQVRPVGERQAYRVAFPSLQSFRSDAFLCARSPPLWCENLCLSRSAVFNPLTQQKRNGRRAARHRMRQPCSTACPSR